MPAEHATVPDIGQLRAEYHRLLCENLIGLRRGSDALTLADSSSGNSRALAAALAERLPYPPCEDPKDGQTAGSMFTEHTREFLEACFNRLLHLRPGRWEFLTGGNGDRITSLEQDDHLRELQRVLNANRELAAALGGDYLVTPDIIVARVPLDDAEINVQGPVVDGSERVSSHTPLRARNVPAERTILHASISCKWTIRSDRAQNTRTEALNLIRNRKGNTPIIVAVTAEPLPSRIASIAMGTGDIDCTYHAALPELQEAAEAVGIEAQSEMLDTLVSGRRLRDISDLPFDLVT